MGKTGKTVKFEIELQQNESRDKEAVKAIVLKALDEGYELLQKNSDVVIALKNPNYSA
jgi:hypothetical protein